MKLGILGGTFNPIHLGHLSIAQDVKDLLSLDSVIFIPAKIPPLKNKDEGFSAAARYRLVEAATKNIPGFEISDIEFRRDGPSYSVQTLQELIDRGGKDKKISPHDLYFILGIEAFLEIKKWRSYQNLFQLANFAVVTRAGIDTDLTQLNTIAEDLGFCYNQLIGTGSFEDEALPLKIPNNTKEFQNDNLANKNYPTKSVDVSTSYVSSQLPLSESDSENAEECRSHKLQGQHNNVKQGNLPRMLKDYLNSSHLHLYLIQTRPVMISSTDIRARLKQNKSIKDLVPEVVQTLIKEEYTTA